MQYVDHKDQKNNYSKRLKMLKSDVAEFTSLTDRYLRLYLGLSSIAGHYIEEIRSIVTDYNIAREQGYKTYSNDEFDLLLSSWDTDQIELVIIVYLRYINMIEHLDERVDSIDNISPVGYSLSRRGRDVSKRLGISLGLLEGEVRAQFAEKIRAYPVQFKGLFNKPTAAAIYENILSVSDSSLFKTCIDNYSRDIDKFFKLMSNFVASYDVLDIKKQMTIEWIRDIIFDPKIVVFP
ncbi:BTA121 domain-containing protein surface lipoprotein, partial [Borrelia persica]|uniref:BTA121 domain-containing protein surface lipoprotein n=1 Tax=Borrelia persica TaxID=44448 RepID=UPI003899254A